MKNTIEIKNIKELKNYKFRIPLYQREYAWGEDEVEQLINDLETFQRRKNNRKYFLGNIVVDKIDENYYDVIDGQQRLTTLYLLMILLKKEVYELNYEIREEDNKFLKDLKNLKDISIKKLKKLYKDINPNFIINIETMKNKTIAQDLLNDVIVTITEIPKEMDVIKYFEVMNNRGKQLEKHQILKAKFLQQLRNDNSKDWAKIWDYCSYMDTPIEDLIYYNLGKKEKSENKVEEIRKNLLNFNYDDYFKGEFKEERKTIKELLEEKDTKSEVEIKSQYEYRSIIKFSIFLIHVLKFFIVQKNLEGKDGFGKLNNIKVNDKDLLDYFYKNNEDKVHVNFLFDTELAKNFLELMLKFRILFDYFIIKRDKNDEPFIFRNDNHHLKMIELLFINSAPQYFAQHWIGVFLKWLYENKGSMININDNLNFNNQEAIKFLEEFDNELAKVRLSDKEISDFIDEKIKDLNNKQIDIKKNLEDILNRGTSAPHYWFYKLDYLLWKNYDWNKQFVNKFKESENFQYSKIKEQYRLTRLHSIEHIYPQSKKDDWECKECNECNCIDCFGNLALISAHLNSALIDKDYNNKRLKIQEQLNNGTIESLKMLLVYSKYQEWDEGNCKDHYDEMIKILEESLN